MKKSEYNVQFFIRVIPIMTLKICDHCWHRKYGIRVLIVGKRFGMFKCAWWASGELQTEWFSGFDLSPLKPNAFKYFTFSRTIVNDIGAWNTIQAAQR